MSPSIALCYLDTRADEALDVYLASPRGGTRDIFRPARQNLATTGANPAPRQLATTHRCHPRTRRSPNRMASLKGFSVCSGRRQKSEGPARSSHSQKPLQQPGPNSGPATRTCEVVISGRVLKAWQSSPNKPERFRALNAWKGHQAWISRKLLPRRSSKHRCWKVVDP